MSYSWDVPTQIQAHSEANMHPAEGLLPFQHSEQENRAAGLCPRLRTSGIGAALNRAE
jgi:hypothetical protein